ncbi:MAG: endopeptidase La [Chloroflexi bacterium]|nr:endopeptidase La [Chloroflexota bacterium]
MMVERFRRGRSGDQSPDQPPRIPGALPVLPLRDMVLFPHTGLPLLVTQPEAIAVLDEVMRGERMLALVTSRDPQVERPGASDLYGVGSVGRIQQFLRRPDGAIMVAIQGLSRIKVWSFLRTEPYLVAEIGVDEVPADSSDDAEALKRGILDQFAQFAKLTPYIPEDALTIVLNVDNPLVVAYLIASILRIDTQRKQRVLEASTVRQALEELQRVLTREIEVSELGQRLQTQAQEQMTKAQREYLLHEQLRAIQKELGEESEGAAAINQLREQIEEAKLPDEARSEAFHELGRLERLSPASPEYSLIRTYLDLMVSLPWSVETGHDVDLEEARRVLDDDHYDLEKIKERIIEYLAVRKLRGERGSSGSAMERHDPILCFVGPPGVGKTSLGQSIARALGRRFLRISLGGIRDEAEIRGHRRTYIGALPGRIIQGLRRIGARDPVFMLDEVDKVQVGWQGDPAAALLEVLDPEQNRDFRDNYLEVPFDLSHVLFIATANTLDTIPAPLLDRMEIVPLSGYTVEEKLHIAEQYLVPKELDNAGLLADEMLFTRDGLMCIIESYTREAGVRSLQRQIGAICRKAAVQIGRGDFRKRQVDADAVSELLGQPVYQPEVNERNRRPGVATGLVYTPAGGDIIFIEVASMPGTEGRLILTGQLGDVMKESAQTALSYVRSEAEELGIAPEHLGGREFHIHVPAGAVPKDGPSAGITMVAALVSLLTDRPFRSDVAMTGEITLRGRVLPIGGVREKVLAARRAGITTVVLPKGNERDVAELTEEVRTSLRFVYVELAPEALAVALASGVGEEQSRMPKDAASSNDSHVLVEGKEQPRDSSSLH